ncbi:hypothetical protein ACFWPX_16245 [Nocardia sp. NPDC058518]|uniref:hypothetical protein n=1 Tax=Nocardia sp. NPDC058518 TaxID=3346534 RepID=UPI003666C58A
MFVTHRRPGPGKYLADRDVCPDTGLARLSYDQARDLLDAATAIEGAGTDWELHELRHSSLTHLCESGAGLLELMAKSRHRKPENLRRYFKLSPQAMRDFTSLLGPGAERRYYDGGGQPADVEGGADAIDAAQERLTRYRPGVERNRQSRSNSGRSVTDVAHAARSCQARS